MHKSEDDKIKNYKKFLTELQSDLDKIFEHQKEYLCCKKGCSLCCERGDYPISKIEFEYLMSGVNLLSEETKTVIKEKIKNIINQNSDSYECPFLENKCCTVYEYRPFVCRYFGVLSQDASGNPTYPFCMHEGLNYYNIYDKEKGHMSMEYVIKGGYKNYPQFFRLNNKVITELPEAKELNIDFGESKPMAEFLKTIN